ncbi:conserved hypothetical protein [Methanocella paludicola SANAE]|uniref:Uncharacterized protein n=1 Tax=Methanocella paludicola (strain DSM 17711 / JCM 13418 / NBRC 101707 / SANAE) TaxID=304371 RepID=D1YVC1_METPS|nr:baseplate J/gp47 family protein [Methanocella paludicola]BAI60393.1 conserved hypothetical protein [Methanocella paludicola SANAE]
MSYVPKAYRDIADAILSQIASGVVEQKFTYLPDGGVYTLSYPEEKTVVKVEGSLNGYPHVFTKDVDYLVSDHTLKWLQGSKPDGNTPFTVYHLAGTPVDITDVNPGSVVRTIIESIAVEMGFLYTQMEAVYESSFIDTATEQALDLVVAMLGVTRKPAEHATGDVTFGRSGEPKLLSVPNEAIVFDGKDAHALKNGMVKSVKSIEGQANGTAVQFAEGTDFRLESDRIVWLQPGKRPDKSSVFYVNYSYYEKIIIPKDSEVSTYSRNSENIRSFKTIREALLTKNSAGKWEIIVPVVATVPGRAGNVFSGSISMMPTAIPGVDYVVNKSDIMGGAEVEGDEELRDRAKRAMERAGKATTRALQLAVQAVEGVTGEVVVIDQPDGVPGIIQVIATGGDREEIENAIEETRSAGIRVELKRPVSVPLDVRLMVYTAAGAEIEAVRQGVDQAVRKYFASLEIGDDVIISRIIEAAVSVSGVKDVREVTINDKAENVRIKRDEKGDCRLLELFMEA